MSGELTAALLAASTRLIGSAHKQPLKGAPKAKSWRRWSLFVSPGWVRQGRPGRKEGKGSGWAAGRASPGCFAPRSWQVEQKLSRLISAARTRPARRPGSNLQHGQSRGAGISADSNLKRAVRAWPSRCLVPAARRGRFRPHLPAGPEITSEGERPLHCPKPTARKALRKCRAAGAGECADAERSPVLRPGF